MTVVQYTCLILVIVASASLLAWLIGFWAKKIIAAIPRYREIVDYRDGEVSTRRFEWRDVARAEDEPDRLT
jgi:hypothetical protein